MQPQTFTRWAIYRETGSKTYRRATYPTRDQAQAEARSAARRWDGAPSRFHIVEETTTRTSIGNVQAAGSTRS